MARILPIHQAGSPVLRERARPLAPEELRSPRIRELIERMRDTMRDAPGVGLAAPQVGESLQLVVIEDRAEYQRDIAPEILAERQREPVPLHVLANPTLTVLDAGPAEFFEGCLSVSGWVALTPRALAVRVEALDEHGQPVTITARGWYARILQHEIDHLHGTLYVDRMYTRTFMLTKMYLEHWDSMSVAEVKRRLVEGAPPTGG